MQKNESFQCDEPGAREGPTEPNFWWVIYKERISWEAKQVISQWIPPELVGFSDADVSWRLNEGLTPRLEVHRGFFHRYQ